MTNPLDHVEQLGAWLRDTDIALLELRGPPGTLRLSSDGTSVRVVDADEPSAAAAPTIAVRALSPVSLGSWKDLARCLRVSEANAPGQI